MLCIAYTIFIIFDTIVIIIDEMEGYDRTAFVHTAYRFLEWIQAILNMLIIMSYLLLFISFLVLIRRERTKFAFLQKTVTAFFSIMLGFLFSSFVLDLVFYIDFDPKDSPEDPELILKQERLVSYTTYCHSGLEILFDIVLVGFLILQAQDSDDVQAVEPAAYEN